MFSYTLYSKKKDRLLNVEYIRHLSRHLGIILKNSSISKQTILKAVKNLVYRVLPMLDVIDPLNWTLQDVS